MAVATSTNVVLHNLVQLGEGYLQLYSGKNLLIQTTDLQFEPTMDFQGPS